MRVAWSSKSAQESAHAYLAKSGLDRARSGVGPAAAEPGAMATGLGSSLNATGLLGGVYGPRQVEYFATFLTTSLSRF
jgi:hypothetical protein